MKPTTLSVLGQKMSVLRTLTLTLTAALFAATLFTSCAPNLPRATERVRPYLVQIVVADNVTNDEALNTTPIGSGFLVNRAAWLVTTKQVIDLGTEEVKRRGSGASMAVVVPGNPALGVGSSSNSNPDALLVNELESVSSQRLSNVVAVKLKTDLLPNPGNGAVRPIINYATDLSGTINIGRVPLDQWDLKAGEVVAVSGLSSNVFALTTSSGRLVSSTAKASHPTDITSSPLLKGAPVYLPNSGAIVGMAINLPGETNVAVIPASDIIEFLDNYGIEWRR